MTTRCHITQCFSPNMKRFLRFPVCASYATYANQKPSFKDFIFLRMLKEKFIAGITSGPSNGRAYLITLIADIFSSSKSICLHSEHICFNVFLMLISRFFSREYMNFVRISTQDFASNANILQFSRYVKKPDKKNYC